MWSRRPLYRRNYTAAYADGSTYDVETLTVNMFRPERGGWTFGLNVEYQDHPSEAQVTLTVLCWRLVVWWRHP